MGKDFVGVIIEESLEDRAVLKEVRIIKTVVEPVTPKHKTPWIRQWTLHTVGIQEKDADRIAKELSGALDSKHNWYADFKNDAIHYIIFRNRVFCVNRASKKEYDEASAYGISLGIPAYRVDFSPYIEEWKR